MYQSDEYKNIQTEAAQMIIILVFSMLSLITGIVIWPMALKHRTAICPPLFPPNISSFKPVWKQKDWFTPKGYKLSLMSAALIGFGALLSAIFWLNQWIGIS